MYMDVQPVEAYKDFLKPTPETEASTDLGISWSHGTRAAIPAAPDMIVVPAERKGATQAVGSMLLRNSHIVVSQHSISHLSAESAEELATAPAQGTIYILHMHVPGWELYAREMVVSSKHRIYLTKAARGGVKIAYHMTAIGRYPAIVHEHLSRLTFSGLYDVVEGIYRFVLGLADTEVTDASMLLQRFGRKVIIAGTLTNTTHYERFTLLGMRAYLRPRDIFLYMQWRHEVLHRLLQRGAAASP